MSSLLALLSFKYYLFCAIALAFNPMVLSGLTGAARGRYKSPVTPEDARGDVSFREQPAPEVERVMRAHRNAIENVPIALIVGLLYVFAGASPTMVAVLMGTCAVFRWLHSVFYLRSMQPWRTMSYGIAALATGAMLVHTLVLAISA